MVDITLHSTTACGGDQDPRVTSATRRITGTARVTNSKDKPISPSSTSTASTVEWALLRLRPQ